MRRRRIRAHPPARKWESEAEMCAAFQKRAAAEGWTVYPETAGHDLVIVAGRDVVGSPSKRDVPRPGSLLLGDQVAIEAKASGNLGVLAQAVPPDRRSWRRSRQRAGWYAVLVGACSSDFFAVASAAGIVVILFPPGAESPAYDLGAPQLRDLFTEKTRVTSAGAAPLVLPLVVDMAAGQPAPRAVTPWKVEAVRVCLKGRAEELTQLDFRNVRIRTFLERGWIELIEGRGKTARYRLVAGPEHDPLPPDLAYPEIVAALAKEKK